MNRSSLLLTSSTEETIVIVLHFINPFHPSRMSSKSSFRSPFDARDKLLRLFKSSMDQEKTYLSTYLSNPNNKKLDATQESFKYSSIPTSFSKSFPWMSRNLQTSDKKTMKVSKFDFDITCISAVLMILKTIGLNYVLLKSRNEEEIFCKVIVCENWLRNAAVGMDYRLKFNKVMKTDKRVLKFKKVPPYGPIWLNSFDKKKGENLFCHYNMNSEEMQEGETLFTFTDKYRIVTKELANFIDVEVLKKYDILLAVFAPHEGIPLAELKNSWANFSSILNPQPMLKIKTYFSEQIAFYFAWMNIYKKFMTVCAIIGTLVSFFQLLAYLFSLHRYFSLSLQIFFNLFLSVWGVLFEKYWIRKEKVLAWKWGTSHSIEESFQRVQFKGIFQKDEVSGKMKTIKDRNVKDSSIKVATMSLLLFVVSLVLMAVISVFQLRVYMMSDEHLRHYGAIIPAIIYAIQIRIFDFIYFRIANLFNRWENHETTKEFNNHLAFKLFLFQFINNYSGLFYIAFFKEYVEVKNCGKNGCLFDLALQLIILFAANLLLNIVELGLPWSLYYFRKVREQHKSKSVEGVRHTLYPIEKQAQMEDYDYAIEDYMEMCIQFGFVALFGASFPLIAAVALFEIVLEIRVDAWKLCYLVKRPEPVKAEEIGIWKNIIVTIAYIGVFTNTGIIVFSSDLLSDYKFEEKFLIFIVVEHVLMLVIGAVKYFIKSDPEKVVLGKNWSKEVLMRKIARTSIVEETKLKSTEFSDDFEFELNKSRIACF